MFFQQVIAQKFDFDNYKYINVTFTAEDLTQ